LVFSFVLDVRGRSLAAFYLKNDNDSQFRYRVRVGFREYDDPEDILSSDLFGFIGTTTVVSAVDGLYVETDFKSSFGSTATFLVLQFRSFGTAVEINTSGFFRAFNKV